MIVIEYYYLSIWLIVGYVWTMIKCVVWGFKIFDRFSVVMSVLGFSCSNRIEIRIVQSGWNFIIFNDIRMGSDWIRIRWIVFMIKVLSIES